MTTLRLWLFVASAVTVGTLAGHLTYYFGVLGLLP